MAIESGVFSCQGCGAICGPEQLWKRVIFLVFFLNPEKIETVFSPDGFGQRSIWIGFYLFLIIGFAVISCSSNDGVSPK